MSQAKERAAEILRGPDGERIWLELVDYAQKIARRYGWRTGKTLPQGFAPGDIVREVIIKVLEGTRSWDEAKEPSFLTALKGMVRSEIGHLFTRYETTHAEPIAQPLKDGSERTGDSFAGNYPNPEELLLQEEETQMEMMALNLILEEVEGKPDLESVFLALYESDSYQDVARLTGLPIQRVYSLRRELNRIATRITPDRVARVAWERRNR